MKQEKKPYLYNTLSQAVNSLTEEGFVEDFETGEQTIEALYTKKQYHPSELKIVKTFRFDGMTNPDDDAVVYAIEASDGKKGTLVMSYSAEHSQNDDLIKMLQFG
ncbi:MAG TPA: phosphoribosylpyrophosphate synthetase [Flavobacteriaceae bacterium]|nr:phosphoribosylpyrophosphate synthetase [Flavobacteriaceae bacterium]